MVEPTGFRDCESAPSAVPGGGLGSFLPTATGCMHEHGPGAADASLCPKLSVPRAVSRDDDPKG